MRLFVYVFVCIYSMTFNPIKTSDKNYAILEQFQIS